MRLLPLSEAELADIGAHVEVKRFKPNQVLLSPGNTCTHAYFVLKGGFVCRYFNDNLETPKTINFYLNDLHPFMACVDSYFFQQPSACELRAIADSEVVCMSKKQIDRLIERYPTLKSFYENVVIQALVEENELKLKIISHSADQLYQYLIAELPEVIQKVPSKYIAEFMGISAEWLSKVKKKKSATARNRIS